VPGATYCGALPARGRSPTARSSSTRTCSWPRTSAFSSEPSDRSNLLALFRSREHARRRESGDRGPSARGRLRRQLPAHLPRCGRLKVSNSSKAPCDERHLRQTAIVTGAASSIGLAIATALAEAGANVVMADIQKDAVEEAAHGLSGTNKRATSTRGVTGCATPIYAKRLTRSGPDVNDDTAGPEPIIGSTSFVACARAEVTHLITEFARDSLLEEAVTSEPVSGKRPEIPSQEGKIRRWVRDRIRRKTGPLPVAEGPIMAFYSRL